MSNTGNSAIDKKINDFLDKVKATNGHEPEFLQAVEEVAEIALAMSGIYRKSLECRQNSS